MGLLIIIGIIILIFIIRKLAQVPIGNLTITTVSCDQPSYYEEWEIELEIRKIYRDYRFIEERARGVSWSVWFQNLPFDVRMRMETLLDKAKKIKEDKKISEKKGECCYK